MQTRKLYYEDAYIQDFQAEVLSCEETKNGWAVILRATAFFPEEGGQTADTGELGGVRVLDVHEKGGLVTHLTDGPLPAGGLVRGRIDWPERFRKMQTHSGEHIVSGLAHSLYGYDNVGFHLGEDGCTIDFNGELTREQLNDLERRANEVVWRDQTVRARFPSVGELKDLDYRSKLDLTEDVRIVSIDGVDMCACCAPHVSSTGQIGMIKLLDFMRHRGGVRIWMKAGSDALADYGARYAADAAISAALNVPQSGIAGGVEKLSAQRDELKRELAGLRKAAAETRAAALEPTEGNMVLFADGDEEVLRILANAGMEKCGGVCAVFAGEDGAWRFVMASKTTDMRAFIKENGPALQARGGGQDRMISGCSGAAKEEIVRFFQ